MARISQGQKTKKIFKRPKANYPMKKQDYTATITVDASLQETFREINNVTKWWTDELKGSSQKLNDEFIVQFGDVHMSTQKLIEFLPDEKVVWLVTDSQLNFIKDKKEWTNTKISFELSRQADKTQIHFTHIGLIPEVECFKSCTRGWDYFIKGSLFKLLTEGKGTPGL
jgi:hypothetical protein